MFQDPGYFPDTLDSSISLTSHIKSIRNSCQFPLQKYIESARISLFVLSLPCPGLCNLWPAEAPPSSPGAPFHSPCSCQNSHWKTPFKPCTGFLPHLERSPGALPDPTRLQLPLSSTSSHLSHAGFAHGWDLCISVPSAGIFSPPLSAHTSPSISSVFGAQLSLPPSQPSCTFLCGNSPALQPPSPPQRSAPPGATCSSVICQGLACCVPHDISSTLWVTTSWCMC